MDFVTTTELQKHASGIATKKSPSLVLRRGKPEGIMLPFFSGYESFLSDYMEAYEIEANRAKLSRELKASKESGISSFSV